MINVKNSILYFFKYTIFSILLILPFSHCHETEEYYLKKIEDAQNNFYKSPGKETQEKWKESILEFHGEFPNSPESAAWYSSLFVFEHGNHQVEKSIMNLLPYLQESEKHPAMPYTLVRIFQFGYINIHDDKLSKWSMWHNSLTGLNLPPQEALRLLASYWARRVPSDSKYANRKSVQQFKEMEINEHEAQKTWVAVLNNVTTFYRRLEQDGYISLDWKEEHVTVLPSPKKSEPPQDRTLIILGTLIQGDNTLDKILRVMRDVKRQPFKKKFAASLPNYQLIEEKKGQSEANILNAFYKAIVLEAFDDVLQLVHQLDNKDERVLILKYYCQTALSKKIEDRLETIKEILKLNPDNTWAQKTRIYLETELEVN